jgi:fimbrial isopeptide formation D2 family protein/LPXTG-motif cell wall-anchored protein
MTKTKRIASITAAAIMAISMTSMSAITSFASASADNATASTATQDTKHTYTAYGIFTGTYDNSKLTVSDWAENFNSTGLLADKDFKAIVVTPATDAAAAVTIGDKLGQNPTAADVAAIIANISSESAEADALADVLGKYVATSGTPVTSGTTTLAVGYYLIKDSYTENHNDALSKYILTVSDNTTAVTINAKKSYPTVVKKVYEEDYKETTYGEGYNDVADHAIGEAVPFKLIGTIPETIGDYEHYVYKFHDTLEAGLTVNADTVVVKIDGTPVYTKDTKDTAATHGLTVTAANQSVEVAFSDITVYGVTAESTVTVEYTATLTGDITSNGLGEQNVVKLEYSNNPNETGWGDSTPSDNTSDDANDSNTPSNPGTPPTEQPDSPSTDETPEDTVVVYTYSLKVTKTDTSNNAITGEAAQAAKFTVKTSDNKYITVDANGVVTGTTTTLDDAKISLDANGELKVVGLEPGTYTITEEVAPTGYNKPSDSFTVTIGAAIVTTQEYGTTVADRDKAVTTDGITVTAGSNTLLTVARDTTDKLQADATIQNTQGTQLPTTGGFGTKLFYIGGGALVLASGVLLVTKRRMKNHAE